MNWYVSKLIFKIEDPTANAVQFDEQWRMIEAAGESEALKKAQAIGHRESELLVKSSGHPVRWEFICVTDLFPFSSDLDGAEIFSRIEQPDNEYLYMLSVTAKSERFLREKPVEAE